MISYICARCEARFKTRDEVDAHLETHPLSVSDAEFQHWRSLGEDLGYCAMKADKKAKQGKRICT